MSTENSILSKVLNLKRAHVKKGTNVRLAPHQLEALTKKVTRIVMIGCMISCTAGSLIGFFTARAIYKKQTFTVFQNGVRSGIVQRDLRLTP